MTWWNHWEDYGDPSVGQSVTVAGVFLLFILLVLLLSVLAAVFLGLCVYNDAQYRRNPNAGVWGVFSGLFSIVALVYLIVALTSKNQPERCLRCGNFLPPSYPGSPSPAVCPVCGQPAPFLPPEQAALYARRRRRYLILWIVMLAACFVLALVMAALVILSLSSLASAY